MSESKSFSLVTVMKWRIPGQGYKHLIGISRFVLFKQYKRLTMSAASIFVTEGLFMDIYFLLFEENLQNRISRAGDKVF